MNTESMAAPKKPLTAAELRKLPAAQRDAILEAAAARAEELYHDAPELAPNQHGGPMGIFRLDCEVVNVADATKSATVPQLLVDTGSEFTWVPEPVLTQVGVKVVKKDLPFLMANGQTITRSTGYAILRSSGFETVDEVVFGQPGDLVLLGARTLEGFGVRVDPGQKRLVAAGPRPAAGSITC